ncbi:MAG: hypothetical protein IPL79_20120 [Myxococcales bacterium]|nr:hypothetical protein [Myxococcales bacterium]
MITILMPDGKSVRVRREFADAYLQLGGVIVDGQAKPGIAAQDQYGNQTTSDDPNAVIAVDPTLGTRRAVREGHAQNMQGQNLQAFGEGAVRGATAGLVQGFDEYSGDRAAENPYLAAGGEIGGIAGGALIGGAVAGTAGLAGGAGAMSTRAGLGAVKAFEATSMGSRIAGSAFARGAIEGSVEALTYGATRGAIEKVVHDKPFAAEALALETIAGFGLGGALGKLAAGKKAKTAATRTASEIPASEFIGPLEQYGPTKFGDTLQGRALQARRGTEAIRYSDEAGPLFPSADDLVKQTIGNDAIDSTLVSPTPVDDLLVLTRGDGNDAYASLGDLVERRNLPMVDTRAARRQAREFMENIPEMKAVDKLSARHEADLDRLEAELVSIDSGDPAFVQADLLPEWAELTRLRREFGRRAGWETGDLGRNGVTQKSSDAFPIAPSVDGEPRIWRGILRASDIAGNEDMIRLRSRILELADTIDQKLEPVRANGERYIYGPASQDAGVRLRGEHPDWADFMPIERERLAASTREALLREARGSGQSAQSKTAEALIARAAELEKMKIPPGRGVGGKFIKKSEFETISVDEYLSMPHDEAVKLLDGSRGSLTPDAVKRLGATLREQYATPGRAMAPRSAKDALVRKGRRPELSRSAQIIETILAEAERVKSIGPGKGLNGKFAKAGPNDALTLDEILNMPRKQAESLISGRGESALSVDAIKRLEKDVISELAKPHRVADKKISKYVPDSRKSFDTNNETWRMQEAVASAAREEKTWGHVSKYSFTEDLPAGMQENLDKAAAQAAEVTGAKVDSVAETARKRAAKQADSARVAALKEQILEAKLRKDSATARAQELRAKIAQERLSTIRSKKAEKVSPEAVAAKRDAILKETAEASQLEREAYEAAAKQEVAAEDLSKFVGGYKRAAQNSATEAGASAFADSKAPKGFFGGVIDTLRRINAVGLAAAIHFPGVTLAAAAVKKYGGGIARAASSAMSHAPTRYATRIAGSSGFARALAPGGDDNDRELRAIANAANDPEAFRAAVAQIIRDQYGSSEQLAPQVVERTSRQLQFLSSKLPASLNPVKPLFSPSDIARHSGYSRAWKTPLQVLANAQWENIGTVEAVGEMWPDTYMEWKVQLAERVANAMAQGKPVPSSLARFIPTVSPSATPTGMNIMSQWVEEESKVDPPNKTTESMAESFAPKSVSSTLSENRVNMNR